MAKNRRSKGSSTSGTRTSRAGGAPNVAPSAAETSPTGPGQPRGASRPAPVARRQSVRKNSWVPIAAAVVVVLAIIGVGVYLSIGNSGQSGLMGVQQADEGRTHVTEGSPLQFKNNPPSSGSHYPSPWAWGPSTTPIDKGYWVHNLEHGGIALLYDCPTACPDVVQIANQAWSTFPKDKFGEVKLVTTPYTGLPNNTKVAAVAWDYVKLYNGDFSLANFKTFYDGHVDRGPEDIP